MPHALGHWAALLPIAVSLLTIAAMAGMMAEAGRPVRKCLSEKSADAYGPYLALMACIVVGTPATLAWLVSLPAEAPRCTAVSFGLAASSCAIGMAAAYEGIRGTWSGWRNPI